VIKNNDLGHIWGRGLAENEKVSRDSPFTPSEAAPALAAKHTL